MNTSKVNTEYGESKKDIHIYSSGIVHCSVCVPKSLSRNDIEAYVNAVNMTGIDSRWKISKKKFADGTANPNQCESDKDRFHYLMVC